MVAQVRLRPIVKEDCIITMLEALIKVPVCALPEELIDPWVGELCFLLSLLPTSINRGLWYARVANQHGGHFLGGPQVLCSYLVERASYENSCWMHARRHTYPPLPVQEPV